MRFFTRSSDLEAQASTRTRSRSRTRSQSIAQPIFTQRPRSRSHARSMPATPLIAGSPARSAPLSKTSTTKAFETPTPPNPVFCKPAIPHDNSLLATGGITAAPITSLADTRHPALDGEEKAPEIDEKFEEEKRAFLEKYDPGEPDIPVTQLDDVNMRRRMMRMLYIDNLLWANARLQRHVWIAASGKDVYKDRMCLSLNS